MEEVIVNTNNQNKFEQSKFMQVFNKFVYSDGTKSTEALSSNNTTVTANVFGQKN